MFVRLIALLLPLLFSTATSAGVELTKIERRIAREPAYRTKPKYCLLVFGPEAKHRVWLVLDGDILYVDKNGNGDLTEAGERIEAPAFKTSTHPAHARERSIEVGDLSVGGLTHTGLEVSQIHYRRKVNTSGGTGGNTAEEWQQYLDSIRKQIPDGLVYDVTIHLDPKCYGRFANAKAERVLHFAWIGPQGQLSFADRASAAPIVHFGGPLTLRTTPAEKLRRGETVERFTVNLGTPGLRPGAFATMSYDLVPTDVHPVVTIRFPAKESHGKPVTRKYILKERC